MFPNPFWHLQLQSIAKSSVESLFGLFLGIQNQKSIQMSFQSEQNLPKKKYELSRAKL